MAQKTPKHPNYIVISHLSHVKLAVLQKTLQNQIASCFFSFLQFLENNHFLPLVDLNSFVEIDCFYAFHFSAYFLIFLCIKVSIDSENRVHSHSCLYCIWPKGLTLRSISFCIVSYISLPSISYFEFLTKQERLKLIKYQWFLLHYYHFYYFTILQLNQFPAFFFFFTLFFISYSLEIALTSLQCSSIIR